MSTRRDQCPLCEAAARAIAGGHERGVAVLDQCVVLLSERQGPLGWCVLVLKEHAEHLDDLVIERQQAVFAEVALVARAVRRCFPGTGEHDAPPRINYECLGNQVSHVHWHVIPRHAGDPDLRSPVWGLPAQFLDTSRTPDEIRKVLGLLRETLVSAARRT